MSGVLVDSCPVRHLLIVVQAAAAVAVAYRVTGRTLVAALKGERR
jgi:hypothetical protein